MSRCVLVLVAWLVLEPLAAAADGAPGPVPGAVEATRPAPETRSATVVVPAASIEDQGVPVRPADLSYGVATRLRWVSIPSWMLNLFTKQNVPLSSWGTAIEFFRRKGNFDFVISLSYTNLSPPDGNWLGDGRDATIDTDFVQFRGLAMYGADASFIWHTNFTDWFGLHYGAGIGIGMIRGDVFRTSNDNTLCTEENAGNLSQCHPKGVTCTGSTCNEQQLIGLGPGLDDPTMPHRFRAPDVPSVLPIINVVVGLNFRLPQVRGWEARLEGGLYNTFFLGGAVGYSF